MAVLYRNHHDSILLQGELLARGIPYTVRSGLRFFEQAHIKDVLAHLRIVLNPRDEASWRRLLLLLPGVGPAKAAAIFQHLVAERPAARGARIGRGDGAPAGQEQGILRGVRQRPQAAPGDRPGAQPRRRGRGDPEGGLSGHGPAQVRAARQPHRRHRAVRPAGRQVRQPRAADRRPAPGRRRLRHGLGRRRRAGRGPRPLHGPPGQGPRVVARLRSSADRGELSRTGAPSTSPAAKTKNGASSTWRSPGP